MTSVEYLIQLKDNFSAGMRNAEKSFQSLNQSTGQLSQTMQSVGLAFGAFEAVNLGKSIINLGMENEKTKLTFDTLLGSTEKSKQALKDLYNFVAKTPFEMEEVKGAAKQMLAYGFTQEQLIPEMKKLGDVAAGLNIPFGEIAYLYGTLKTQGRAYTKDIMQFAGRGIPIYEELAKVLKVPQNEVKKLVEDGKVGFNEVSKAFANMTGEGGKFANLMGTLSGSTGGQLSNMKDNFTLAGIALGEAMLPKVKELIKIGMKLGEWIKNNTALILKWVGVIGQVIKYYVIFKATILVTLAAIKAYNMAVNIAKMSTALLSGGMSRAAAQAKALNTSFQGFKGGLIGVGIVALTLAVEWFIKLRKAAKEARGETESFLEAQKGLANFQISKQDIYQQFAKFKQGKLSEFEINALMPTADTLISGAEQAIIAAKTEASKTLALLKSNEETYQKYSDLANKAIDMDGMVAWGRMAKGAKDTSFDTWDNYVKLNKEIKESESSLQKLKNLKILLPKTKEDLTQSEIENKVITAQEDINAKVTGAAPKIFNITINQLTGIAQLTTNTIQEGAKAAGDIVLNELMRAFADIQVQSTN